MREVINVADEKEVTIANTHVPDKLYGYGLQRLYRLVGKVKQSWKKEQRKLLMRVCRKQVRIQ